MHTESETFDRRALAEQWMRRRESKLDSQRSRGEPIGRRMTVGEMAEWYEDRASEPADRNRQQAFRLGRYLPRESESCDLPF